MEENKSLQAKIREQEKQIKNKVKELEDARGLVEKIKNQHVKKYTQLELERKKLSENLDIKVHEIEKLRQ